MSSAEHIIDEDALVRAVASHGDPEAFRQLVERYQDRVYRLVCSVLGPYRDADAEDATQDAFLRCYRRIASFRGDSAFSSWLYRIAYNCALDHRAKARFIPVEIDYAVLTDPDTPIDLARAMEGLPDLYRTIVYLYYWQDCSLAEISQYTGVGEGTLKSWLARAREQLRKKLK